MTCEEVMAELRALADPEAAAGMARYGIRTDAALGVSIYKLRPLARQIGRDHGLALALWDTGVHEARILASFVDEPKEVSEDQVERWALDFDSWDTVDQVTDLFERAGFGWIKAMEWSSREEEFVKRAAFALMAGLAVHDKKADDDRFLALFPVIEREAWDERNFVKKAVNWALRNIGKRNAALNAAAVQAAERIEEQGSRSARWIARDALRELRSDKVRNRLGLET
jgi:3-methyladenine DNA glycosylase AlkD